MRYLLGSDPEGLIEGMVADGFDREASTAAIHGIRDRNTRARRDLGWQHVILGAAISLIGAAGVYIAYSAPSGGGGYYLPTGGVTGVGLLQIWRGWKMLSRRD